MTKKRFNSHNKGSTYERKIAKVLADWSGEEVNRVPRSGGGGVAWQGDTRMVGDLTFPIDSKNPFVYEMKKQEGWKMRHVITGQGAIPSWWEQAVGDTLLLHSTGKIGVPLLVFSQNRDRDYVAMPFMEKYFNLVFPQMESARMRIKGKEGLYDVIVMTLDTFITLDKDELFEDYAGYDWQKNTITKEVAK